MLSRVRWPTLLVLLAATAACMREVDVLERIVDEGVLHVATQPGPTSCSIVAGKPSGFECELLARFAHELGVRLEVHFVDAFGKLLPAVEQGDAHIAAGGIAITPRRRQRVRFAPAYTQTTPQVVYRHGQPRPEGVPDLPGFSIEVRAGSAEAARLADLAEDHPGLTWREVKGVEVEALLQRVDDGRTDLTIADASRVDVARRDMPHLRPAFSLGRALPVAWALPPRNSRRLARRLTRFFEQLELSGELSRLRAQYFGRGGSFDFVDTRTLLEHTQRRLPAYRPLFESAARRTGLDWELLAAMSYQESHWDPDARSFTGVAGLMMLTRDTAQQMGVGNRNDPGESILGGARYLERVLAKIPQRIPEPDRTWLALAAYNVGFGHLEDARILAESAGEDPDRWSAVRKYLPRLAQPEWHSRTRFGYARGDEPVRFVENIRRYRDTLRLAIERVPASAGTEPIFDHPAGS